MWHSVLRHHGEPADPALLEWIGHLIDDLVSAGPLAIVVVLGVAIVAIPAVLVAWYLVARNRGGGDGTARGSPPSASPRR